MSFIVFVSRHKAFSAGPAGGGSAAFLPCSGDVPDFIRLNQLSTTNTCTLLGFPPPSDTETAQIGNTKFVSGNLPATAHAANSDLTLINRGCRARYDYYFWQGNDIWRYDSRIETSGTLDTFSTWEVDATPVSSFLEGTTLGLYPMLIPESGGGKGPLRPHIVTAAFDGSSVVFVKKNLITGVWSSGNIGTLSNPGNGIPVAETIHNNKIYFITDQDNSVGVLDAELETVQEVSWPEEVRHPMDLNVFVGRVYCLNKTVKNSGVAIWEVDGVTGLSKALRLDSNRYYSPMTSNYAGRNMLFSCYTASPVGSGADGRPTPHMMAFQWTQALNSSGVVITSSGSGLASGVQPPGTEAPGIDVYAVKPTGNGGLVFVPESATRPFLTPQQLADEWNYLNQGKILTRPGIALAGKRNTEDNIYRCWVDDATNSPSGDPFINIIFRENPDDGAVYRQYRYRNNPYEDKLSLLGAVYQSGQAYTGKYHFSYTHNKFGGGHYDATWAKPDITVSGIEVTNERHNRIWFIVDGDFLHPSGKEITVQLTYGGTGDRLSSPHTNLGRIVGASRGTIVNDTLYQTLEDGVPQYIDWNGFANGFSEGDRVNFTLLMAATGNVPVPYQKKQTFPMYLNVGAPLETTSTGPDIPGTFFNVTDRDESSTSPDIPGVFLNTAFVDTAATGPGSSATFFNIGFDSAATGPIATASGIFTLSTPASGLVQRPVIWWGFRTSQRTISGFGRAQGRLR